MAFTPTEEALLKQLAAQNASLLNLAASETTIISKLGATKVTLSDLDAVTTPADADIMLARQGTDDKGLALSLLKEYSQGGFTTSRALVSDSSGKVAVSAVTATELGYVDGVTSAIQTQLNAKVALTGNQTVAGVKTFSSSPIVPTADATGEAVHFGQFLASLTGDGYQKLPSGLIIQWGVAYANNTAWSVVAFPIAFPNNVFSVVRGQTYISVSGPRYGGIRAGSILLTQFEAAQDLQSDFFYWCAIGN